MNKNFILIVLISTFFLAAVVHSCKKDSNNMPTHTGTEISFTEEFENVSALTTKGWVIKDNSSLGSSGPFAAWAQGANGPDKGGSWIGFYAYSYTALQDEFAYSFVSSGFSNYSISSWLITPVLSVKNGDKISFYTRADTTGNYTDRLQVLMNNSASAIVGSNVSSVGSFTNILFDINSAQAVGGYPMAWTKYEYTFSGITGKIDTRIGFRHYAINTTNPRGIGIDLFRFQVN